MPVDFTTFLFFLLYKMGILNEKGCKKTLKQKNIKNKKTKKYKGKNRKIKHRKNIKKK
jgi:hypothetical protein